jgi:hypothetical protein
MALSIAAGLLGGALSSHLWPLTAHAQSQAQEEIRARCFTVDSHDGVTLGSFSYDNSGRSQIVLRDRFGHDLWRVVADHTADCGPGTGMAFMEMRSAVDWRMPTSST